eukprot:gene6747-6967_t
MRASLDEMDLNWSMEDPSLAADEALDGSDDATPSTADSTSSTHAAFGSTLPGQADPLTTVEMLEELEDPDNFIARDFAIVKLLGKLAMQGPVTVQLREYLPGSRRVAVNEMKVQQRLCGPLPREKWQAAAADPKRSCPVVKLLGYLEAPPSDDAFEITDDPADTLWMVFKFEGMRPMSLMLQQIDVPEEPAGLQTMFMSKEAAVAAAIQGRYSLLQGIAEQLLQALSFCHQRGVAHCGLGTGSVVLNTWQDKDVDRLMVKLDNFGLSRLYPHPLETPSSADVLASFAAGSGNGGNTSNKILSISEDTDALQQRQEDLQAAALLLTEVFMVGAAAAGAEVMDVPALKRLLFDVFHEDLALFKEYCLQDAENFAGFVDFMDDRGGAGWDFLEQLLAGRTAAGELLGSCRFFARANSDVPAK